MGSRGWPRIILAAAGAGVLVWALPGPARARPAEQPPECVPVAIASDSGTGPVYHFRFCGAGAGGDSPLADWAAHDQLPLVVDGSQLAMTGCGSLASPCVIIRQG